MAKNYINKEKITKILKITEIEYDESNETYDYSYPYLIKGMEELRLNAKSKEEWVIIGSSMVYSWMPRILNFTKSNNYKKCIKNAIGELKKIEEQYKIYIDGGSFKDMDIKKENLDSLVHVINNSVVGVSKFLHFSFPEAFPIWDSRVERAFSGVANNYQRTNNLDNYIAYLYLLHDVKNEEFSLIKENKEIFEKYDDKIRKIEYALFIIGGKK